MRLPSGAAVLTRLRAELPAIRRWGRRGFWAVTDQALFAGTNFLVNILLARWLEPAAYGAFSVAFSLFLLFGTLHTALWTEPMLVYGSGRFRASFRAYQGALLRDHWRFGGGVALAFLLLAAVFGALGQKEMALSFLGLSLAAPSVLCLWLVRRGVYVLLEPRLAAAGGALYLVLYLSLAFLLLKTGLLNEATAFWGMALAALLAAWAIRARVPGEGATGVDPEEVRRLHWGYGRWALLAGALSWVPANLPLVFLGAARSLEESALFRATYNLYMPVLHFQTALNSLFFPWMARRWHEGRRDFRDAVHLPLLVHGASALGFLALGPWVGEAAGFLYGGRYPEVVGLFWWMAPVPLVAVLTHALEAWNRGTERPAVSVPGYALAALVALGATPLAVVKGGAQGGAVALVLASLALAVGLYLGRAR